MKLDLTDMLYALSFTLDKVEAELVGVGTGHGKRVAYLAVIMGRAAGFEHEELRDFIGCCLLHDNALTEFIHGELKNSPMSRRLSVNPSDLIELADPKLILGHSVIGEENIHLLPFRTDVKNIILYHHENADGSGAMGKTASEIPLKAQILHLADFADTTGRLNLESMTPADFENLGGWLRDKSGKLFSREVVDLFLSAVTYKDIESFQRKGLAACMRGMLQDEVRDYSDDEVRNIADLFAKIVDYKSVYTHDHSRGVAEKAEIMARHYGFDAEKTIRFYFAGAMHDIGKLAIVNGILEKPGKLTPSEFEEIKNHSDATYYVLSQIKGIPDIVKWASNHHEKLNGSGYPNGLTAAELSFEEQLMACIDIYQALTEKRPYKDGMSHEDTLALMRNMADRGELNAGIIDDIDAVMNPARR